MLIKHNIRNNNLSFLNQKFIKFSDQDEFYINFIFFETVNYNLKHNLQ